MKGSKSMAQKSVLHNYLIWGKRFSCASENRYKAQPLVASGGIINRSLAEDPKIKCNKQQL